MDRQPSGQGAPRGGPPSGLVPTPTTLTFLRGMVSGDASRSLGGVGEAHTPSLAPAANGGFYSTMKMASDKKGRKKAAPKKRGVAAAVAPSLPQMKDMRDDILVEETQPLATSLSSGSGNNIPATQSLVLAQPSFDASHFEAFDFPVADEPDPMPHQPAEHRDNGFFSKLQNSIDDVSLPTTPLIEARGVEQQTSFLEQGPTFSLEARHLEDLQEDDDEDECVPEANEFSSTPVVIKNAEFVPLFKCFSEAAVRSVAEVRKDLSSQTSLTDAPNDTVMHIAAPPLPPPVDDGGLLLSRHAYHPRAAPSIGILRRSSGAPRKGITFVSHPSPGLNTEDDCVKVTPSPSQSQRDEEKAEGSVLKMAHCEDTDTQAAVAAVLSGRTILTASSLSSSSSEQQAIAVSQFKPMEAIQASLQGCDRDYVDVDVDVDVDMTSASEDEIPNDVVVVEPPKEREREEMVTTGLLDMDLLLPEGREGRRGRSVVDVSQESDGVRSRPTFSLGGVEPPPPQQPLQTQKLEGLSQRQMMRLSQTQPNLTPGDGFESSCEVFALADTVRRQQNAVPLDDDICTPVVEAAKDPPPPSPSESEDKSLLFVAKQLSARKLASPVDLVSSDDGAEVREVEVEGASDVEGGDVEMADGADGGVGAEGGGDSNDVGIEIDTLPPQSQSFDLSPADSLIAPALLYSKAHMSNVSDTTSAPTPNNLSPARTSRDEVDVDADEEDTQDLPLLAFFKRRKVQQLQREISAEIQAEPTPPPPPPPTTTLPPPPPPISIPDLPTSQHGVPFKTKPLENECEPAAEEAPQEGVEVEVEDHLELIDLSQDLLQAYPSTAELTTEQSCDTIASLMTESTVVAASSPSKSLSPTAEQLQQQQLQLQEESVDGPFMYNTAPTDSLLEEHTQLVTTPVGQPRKRRRIVGTHEVLEKDLVLELGSPKERESLPQREDSDILNLTSVSSQRTTQTQKRKRGGETPFLEVGALSTQSASTLSSHLSDPPAGPPKRRRKIVSRKNFTPLFDRNTLPEEAFTEEMRDVTPPRGVQVQEPLLTPPVPSHRDRSGVEARRRTASPQREMVRAKECALCRGSTEEVRGGVEEVVGRRAAAQVDEVLFMHSHCLRYAKISLDSKHGLTRRLEAAASQRCTACNAPGATVSCTSPSCHNVYHLPCALLVPNIVVHNQRSEVHCGECASG